MKGTLSIVTTDRTTIELSDIINNTADRSAMVANHKLVGRPLKEGQSITEVAIKLDDGGVLGKDELEFFLLKDICKRKHRSGDSFSIACDEYGEPFRDSHGKIPCKKITGLPEHLDQVYRRIDDNYNAVKVLQLIQKRTCVAMTQETFLATLAEFGRYLRKQDETAENQPSIDTVVEKYWNSTQYSTQPKQEEVIA